MASAAIAEMGGDMERANADPKSEEDFRKLAAIASTHGDGFALECAATEIGRLRGALDKIVKRYPCDSVDTMSRLAKEALGL